MGWFFTMACSLCTMGWFCTMACSLGQHGPVHSKQRLPSFALAPASDRRFGSLHDLVVFAVMVDFCFSDFFREFMLSCLSIFFLGSICGRRVISFFGSNIHV